jgi:hypothetical protein
LASLGKNGKPLDTYKRVHPDQWGFTREFEHVSVWVCSVADSSPHHRLSQKGGFFAQKDSLPF